MVGVLCISITILFSINTFVLAQPDGGLAFFFFFFFFTSACIETGTARRSFLYIIVEVRFLIRTLNMPQFEDSTIIATAFYICCNLPSYIHDFIFIYIVYILC